MEILKTITLSVISALSFALGGYILHGTFMFNPNFSDYIILGIILAWIIHIYQYNKWRLKAVKMINDNFDYYGRLINDIEDDSRAELATLKAHTKSETEKVHARVGGLYKKVIREEQKTSSIKLLLDRTVRTCNENFVRNNDNFKIAAEQFNQLEKLVKVAKKKSK